MSEERLSASSPFGAIRLNADATTLEIVGEIAPRPLAAARATIPGLAFACLFIVLADSLLSASAILGYGFVAFALWCLNSTRRKTVLRLTRDGVELEEALLFSRRRIQARIQGTPVAALDAIQWEDWEEDMLCLRTQEDSRLYVLKRHSVDDLLWAGIAIERWFNGGPHTIALHRSSVPVF
jgi:hypothetical protein